MYIVLHNVTIRYDRNSNTNRIIPITGTKMSIYVIFELPSLSMPEKATPTPIKVAIISIIATIISGVSPFALDYIPGGYGF